MVGKAGCRGQYNFVAHLCSRDEVKLRDVPFGLFSRATLALELTTAHGLPAVGVGSPARRLA